MEMAKIFLNWMLNVYIEMKNKFLILNKLFDFEQAGAKLAQAQAGIQAGAKLAQASRDSIGTSCFQRNYLSSLTSQYF